MSQNTNEKIANSSKEIIQQLRRLVHHRKPMSVSKMLGGSKIFLVPSQESWLANIGYILCDVIAVGRYGSVVHRADDVLGNGRVAVKIVKLIHMNKWGMSREQIQMNIRDHWLKLNHPHVCRLHDVVIGRRKVFFITEFACQGDIQQFIQNEEKYKLVFPLTIRLWCYQISAALKYLHNQRLAHCDLKLENILLNCKLNVKLTDIGFAWNIYDQNETEQFTKAYAAPEGTIICEMAADLWSLGVVFYALWNRCLPFPGHAERDVILNVQRKDVPWNRGNKHPVDQLASDLVCKLLQIPPKDRINCTDVINHQLFTFNFQ